MADTNLDEDQWQQLQFLCGCNEEALVIINTHRTDWLIVLFGTKFYCRLLRLYIYIKKSTELCVPTHILLDTAWHDWQETGKLFQTLCADWDSLCGFKIKMCLSQMITEYEVEFHEYFKHVLNEMKWMWMNWQSCHIPDGFINKKIIFQSPWNILFFIINVLFFISLNFFRI